MMGKTAIVIGATGLVGAELVRQLSRAAHVGRVVALTRRALADLPPKVENHLVDFDRLDDYADLFRGDLFFSALGTTRAQAGSLAAQRRVDVDYQIAAARIAAGQGVGHCLLVSAAGANARALVPYSRMKGEVEAADSAMPFARVSIFQPSVLIGPRDHSRPGEHWSGRLLGALTWVPVLGRYRPITGAEVAAKMIRVSGRDGPARQTFNLLQMFDP